MSIRLEGDKRLRQALARFPAILAEYLRKAGEEASELILETEGLRSYPPATPANQPPTPYYARGQGMQYESYNDGRSEQYNEQWRTEQRGYGAVIENSASYAGHLAGEEQSQAMAEIGWRKLWDVTQEKALQVAAIYNAWVGKALRKAGL